MTNQHKSLGFALKQVATLKNNNAKLSTDLTASSKQIKYIDKENKKIKNTKQNQCTKEKKNLTDQMKLQEEEWSYCMKEESVKVKDKDERLEEKIKDVNKLKKKISELEKKY
mmetsp:Transcript_8764/g.14162  ORF Transcript_8764/g.14162 Transcript_8764/m.14162 type:complete len:112 (-) Transcript_8764:119-454(-)|eukprot:CAMPEP_0196189846 /NCGR_PEP_ID=MMETSP0911-20130528/45122_1 /TAXON_ID=49265 /ORGANISM="Thalassiosira rotula, Strain GSO102" /LENGTH=111 /DNA_ID=CAMNT_0041461543 /DNA_START=620 /DNA_END=955 /DNA_ORIENTATION=+